MGNIRYVCLSDMHLGEKDSLLTNLNDKGAIDTKKASPVMEQLVKCLKYIISESNKDGIKPTLVLNGDIFELALAEMNTAAMVFDRFLELIKPYGDRLFKDIVYIPGNHDHHFWEIAREDQYVNYITKKIEQGDDMKPPWHTTNVFMEDPHNLMVPAYFINNLIERYARPSGAKRFNASVAYPNFGIVKKFKDKSNRCIVFHHGHFIESIYMLMSNLSELFSQDDKNNNNESKEIWQIEGENFAWIDFFWSTMGRSGDVGEKVEFVYESLDSKERVNELINILSKNLAKKYGKKGIIPDKIESMEIKFVLQEIAKRYILEKKQIDSLLGDDSEDGLLRYLNIYLKKRLLDEKPDLVQYDLTFVFGHTHKPYQRVTQLEKYTNEVGFYNSGGWTIDIAKVKPLHGGAVILIDDDFNVASLRIYNEAQKQGDYKVKVEKAGTVDNPLHQQITELVERPSERAFWNDFSGLIFKEVHRRLEYIGERMGPAEND
ncbi:MAG: metallophosphoesterase [Candidatus Poribacteria bacterium]